MSKPILISVFRWIRVMAVLCYVVAVCFPALLLSVYYVAFWNPRYIEKVRLCVGFLMLSVDIPLNMKALFQTHCMMLCPRVSKFEVYN
ncbi:unnamed protein product [Soboliphyme baturini]|uniref:Uncharacterized protein n=1 Tax=Soboliphyme baturini TaxID=241478 RepID=A0A183J4L3_9BILA|nr:unnamed protein product [Soboliphyme baturini]